MHLRKTKNKIYIQEDDPKMKSHRGAMKRLHVTGSGKVKRNKAYKSHILTKKTAKRKRGLRKATTLTSADLKRMLRSMAK